MGIAEEGAQDAGRMGGLPVDLDIDPVSTNAVNGGALRL